MGAVARLRRSEAGAFLVVWALLLLGLLTMVAIVIDLGALRGDRRTDRAAADAAAAAGASFLNASPNMACRAAWGYALVNLRLDENSFSTPCGALTTCSLPAPNVVGVAGDYRIRIVHPVVDTDPILTGADAVGGHIPQPADGNADGAACERIGVEITFIRRALFSNVVGSRQTTVHSVARLGPGGPGDETAPLVLLERRDCRAMRTQGQNTRIVVRRVGATTAGAIQVDSRGDQNCQGVGTKIVEGQATSNGPSIVAEHARDGANNITRRARIGIYAKLFGFADSHSPWPTTVGDPDPIGFRQVGRTPGDERYLENVRALGTAASPVVQSATLPSGYVDATGPAPGLNLGCTIDRPAPITDVEGSRLWFNCPGGLTVNNLTIDSSDAEVVINGPLTVNSPGFVIRDARKVWIRGRSSANKIGADIKGTFIVNSGSSATCGARFAVNRNLIGTVFLHEGSLQVSGAVFRVCQSFVYLNGATSTTASWLPAGVTPPPALPPAPANNDSTGKVTVTAGVLVDWTAPSQLDALPTLADLAVYKYEDLALWTEASDRSSLNGGGGMTLGGIFFLPNANTFDISGGAAGDLTVDAQFWARKLDVSGNATLFMIPNPANQVPIPTAKVSMIR